MKSDDKIKIFVAAPLAGEFRDDLLKIGNQADTDKDFTLTFQYNVHLTCCFIGYVQTELLHTIIHNIEKVCRQTKPFQLKIKAIDWKKQQAHRGMLWAEFEECDAYEEFYFELHEILEIPIQYQKPVPHITLGRYKNSFDPALHLIRFENSYPPLEVREVELWQSTHDKWGVKYISLKQFPLA